MWAAGLARPCRWLCAKSQIYPQYTGRLWKTLSRDLLGPAYADILTLCERCHGAGRMTSRRLVGTYSIPSRDLCWDPGPQRVARGG